MSATASGEGFPLDDLVAESERVLLAARRAGVLMRLAGGLAIRQLCPAAILPPLARGYADLDLAVTSDDLDRRALNDLMRELGYEADEMFNALNGQTRLYFNDRRHGRHADVFIDAIRMCHVIEFKARIRLLEETLTPTDLLLSKLQIVELNQKDVVDLLALLHDQRIERGAPDAIDLAYLQSVWGNDWPLWRTSQLTLAKIKEAVSDFLPQPARERVLASALTLDTILESGPKSLRWRLRARVGQRVRWYELPEEDVD